MKKFLITCLSMAFLLPAFASAEDSYCVSFPKGGNSKWSTRDNVIQARFRYDFIGLPTPSGVDAAYRPKFWQSSGVVKGSKGTNKPVSGYTTYQYGTGDLCIYNPAPDFGEVIAKLSSQDFRDSGQSYRPAAREVRLDVKWGGDCNKVYFKNGRFTGTHRFEIYRRKGDHINPFGCRRK